MDRGSMGITAAAPIPEGTGALAPELTVGLGIGGISLTVALVFLLAYLDIFDASEHGEQLRPLHTALKALAIPLFLAFLGIIAFETLSFFDVLTAG